MDTLALEAFFGSWQDLKRIGPSPSRLAAFFQQWQALPSSSKIPANANRATASFQKLLTAGALKEWFDQIAEPMAAARRSGLLCDPWAIAGLRKNEVRNSRVLAWLLNPNGSHGFGDAVLGGLLGIVYKKLARSDFPSMPSNRCVVRTESYPDSSLGSRVDIEIDDAGFYMVIEVKIRALEQCEQLARYGDIASRKSRGRPWCLVFLSKDGVDAKTAGEYAARTISLDWKTMSKLIAHVLPEYHRLNPHERVTRLLAHRFARHVFNF